MSDGVARVVGERIDVECVFTRRGDEIRALLCPSMPDCTATSPAKRGSYWPGRSAVVAMLRATARGRGRGPGRVGLAVPPRSGKLDEGAEAGTLATADEVVALVLHFTWPSDDRYDQVSDSNETA